jgi:hypothetical protein
MGFDPLQTDLCLVFFYKIGGCYGNTKWLVNFYGILVFNDYRTVGYG